MAVRLLRRCWLAVVSLPLLLTLASCSGIGDDPPPSWAHDPNPDSAFRLAVLGDSYISGEGAGRYLDGTDESRFGSRNMCHRAPTAYPFLVAKQLKASMVTVACSGALTGHVTGKGPRDEEFPPQYRDSRKGVFGARAQLLDLRDYTHELDAVLISLGGNDAGFREIVTDCISPFDCSDSKSKWFQRLESQVYPAMAQTYAAVKERVGDVEVFAMTYPNPLRRKYCGELRWVEKPEWEFLETFIEKLNEKVKSAAAAAGLRVIDLHGALIGHRFCDPGKRGINFVKVKIKPTTVIDLIHLGDRFKESLHPNVLGHELMGKVVLSRLQALQAEELPPPPAPDRELPQLVPSEASPPTFPFPPGTACEGNQLADVQSVFAPPEQREVTFSNARPGSTVCFRVAGADWQSKQVGTMGRVRVPIDVSGAGEAGVNHILVQGIGGSWREIVVSRPPGESGS
jgi:lysophospholipase L1-like esterase